MDQPPAVSLCISCNLEVTYRQEGLQCSGCDRWQHRRCGTGITRNQYREANRTGGFIDWDCEECRAAVPQVPQEEDAPLPADRSLYAGDLGDFQPAEDHVEPEMADPAPAPQLVEGDLPLAYKIVQDASNKGKVC